MSKTCNECNDLSKVIMSSGDWQKHEQRHVDREKRYIGVIVLLIVLLVATNIGWLIYESQFETVEETYQEVVQEADNGTNNFIGGDYIGETNDKNQDN